MYTQPLFDLVVAVFETIGFVTHHPMQILKHPLADSRLSYILTRIDSKKTLIGVIISDWKRIVGVRQIHKAEEVLQACPELSQVLIISSMGFSQSAKRISENKKEISLISRRELITIMTDKFEIL